MLKQILFFFCLSATLFSIESASVHSIAVLKYGDKLPDEGIALGIWIDPCLDLPRRAKLSKILSPYLSQPVSQEDLECIEKTIDTHYKRNLRPIVSVVIPPQDLSQGLLRVLVVEPVVESISLSGNRWTSDQFLIRNSGLQEGLPLNSYNLQRNLAWINRGYFRETDILLSPGYRAGTTHVELVTKERFPLRTYAGADNTGTVFLRHTRIYAGFNAGNLWGVNHQSSFQWTTAPDPHVLTSFSGQYLAPFPWYHQLLFYGGYSRFKGDLPENLMSQNGEAWQVSSRYQIPIPPIFGNFLQQISFGYDFKRTNSELLFGGIPFQGAFADINQFYLGYLLDYPTESTKTSLLFECFGSPFHITHDQNNHDYQQLRPFAKSKYAYGRARFSHTRPLFYGFLTRINLAGQLTGWNLLASEQFPLGGWETVRGYEERAFNADSGFLSSLEIATKNLFLIRSNGCKPNHFLEILGFVDYGWGRLHQPFFGQKKMEWLLGVGPGIRYHYKTNIVLRGDIGFPLHKAGVGRHGTHYYGGATVSF